MLDSTYINSIHLSKACRALNAGDLDTALKQINDTSASLAPRALNIEAHLIFIWANFLQGGEKESIAIKEAKKQAKQLKTATTNDLGWKLLAEINYLKDIRLQILSLIAQCYLYDARISMASQSKKDFLKIASIYIKEAKKLMYESEINQLYCRLLEADVQVQSLFITYPFSFKTSVEVSSKLDRLHQESVAYAQKNVASKDYFNAYLIATRACLLIAEMYPGDKYNFSTKALTCCTEALRYPYSTALQKFFLQLLQAEANYNINNKVKLKDNLRSILNIKFHTDWAGTLIKNYTDMRYIGFIALKQKIQMSMPQIFKELLSERRAQTTSALLSLQEKNHTLGSLY